MYVIELYMEIGTSVLSSSSNQFNGHGTCLIFTFVKKIFISKH